MSADFAAYIPVVNRFDLLVRAIKCVPDLWLDMSVIDNTPCGLPEGLDIPNEIRIMRPPVPLSYSQSLNWALRDCQARNKAFLVNMHSDALVGDAGAVNELLTYGRRMNTDGKKWGILWTFYDILCAFNPEAISTVGGWDTNLPNYFTDNDMTRRLQVGGWECMNTNITSVSHEGSATINSDPYLKHVTAVMFPLFREYYRQRWGGTPGQEIFDHPFGAPPETWQTL